VRKLLGLALLMAVFGYNLSYGNPVSNEEILKKLEELEKRVKELERENRELKRLLRERTSPVTLRKKTKEIKVGGRILFRFSQAQDISEGEKTIFGDPGNGFTVRKARLNVKGKLNNGFGYKIQIRADRGSSVQLWDAYVKYGLPNLPLSLKLGQFKLPVSMSYLKSGTKLSLPERPVAVNKVAPVWRDVGVALTYKPFKKTKLTAGVFNGECWSSSKNYNRDKNYLYTLSLDSAPIDNENFYFRFRVGGVFGTDSEQKGYKKEYNISSVKRHLLDLETNFKFKPYNLSFEAGYLYDNPTDVKDENGKEISFGNVKGYYLQVDYGLLQLPQLHIVGRYSYVDPNTDRDDNKDVDYTTLGFYYLISGWQAAVRTSYTWANERHGEEVNNNLFTTEFQLLF
jgi:hypothetical protein